MEIKKQFGKFPDMLKEEGDANTQAFTRTFRQMEEVVEQYNHDLARWKSQTSKPKHSSPPEKESVRENSDSFSSRASKRTLERSPLTKRGNLDTNHRVWHKPYTADYIFG